MADTQSAMPDNTAVRVALWRAIHVLDDPSPHVIEDKIGLRLAAPDPDWRGRPDMDPDATRFFRASILARAVFIEDFVEEQVARGVAQYLILGAGLDTFAQRRPEIASKMHVFEIDQPMHQAWKRQRLIELGYGIPEWLRLVPADFGAGEDWWQRIQAAGFDLAQPAVVASAGVSMYLTKDAIATTMRRLARLATGSALLMTFLLPMEFAEPALRANLENSMNGARASGTPIISFFTPEEITALALDAGFREVNHVSAESLARRYFADRKDGLRPPDHGEEILVAKT